MSDLINRKALNEAISYALYGSIRLDVSDIRDIINNQPTAYDVDKVVSELKSHNNTEKMATTKLYNGEHRYYRAVSVTKAIKIVKGGGVDE